MEAEVRTLSRRLKLIASEAHIVRRSETNHEGAWTTVSSAGQLATLIAELADAVREVAEKNELP